jgi:predicted nucleic acid-binding protein
MKLLLDTNRLSDALVLVDEVLANLETAEAIFVPVIALGEIRAGFRSGRRPAKNEMRLQWFLSQEGITTIGVDPPVSHRFAQIHSELQKRGRPIPTNDLWIAAIAIEQGLVLYTRDAHFSNIPELACL